MQRRLQEVTEELEDRRQELAGVYQCLGQAEERIALQSWAQEALDKLAPPTTTVASTQTEDPSRLPAMPLADVPPTPPVPTTAGSIQQEVVPMAEGPTMPSGEEIGVPPALDTQTPAAPPSTAPPPPTIEVQGPTPLNSQEGEKVAAFLEVPTAPAFSGATPGGPPRRTQSRSRSPAPNPADCRRSSRLATPTPSVVAVASPVPVVEPRHSPRIATPSPSPGSLKRSSTPADKEPPVKKRQV
jgi:hypothetical protein